MILYSYFECTKLLNALHQNIWGTARWAIRYRDVRQWLEAPEISAINRSEAMTKTFVECGIAACGLPLRWNSPFSCFCVITQYSSVCVDLRLRGVFCHLVGGDRIFIRDAGIRLPTTWSFFPPPCRPQFLGLYMCVCVCVCQRVKTAARRLKMSTHWHWFLTSSL
jgi:hypothetical protein